MIGLLFGFYSRLLFEMLFGNMFGVFIEWLFDLFFPLVFEQLFTMCQVKMFFNPLFKLAALRTVFSFINCLLARYC